MTEILKKDTNIRLRKKKLKDYTTDADIDGIEMDDLIDLDREIEQIVKDKKKAKVAQLYKKIDYNEREVRKCENQHIKTWYSDKTIDVEELKTTAENLHMANLESRMNIQTASEMKSTYVTKKNNDKTTEYLEELVTFKSDIAKSYKEKIIERVLERLRKNKEERDALEEEQRKK